LAAEAACHFLPYFFVGYSCHAAFIDGLDPGPNFDSQAFAISSAFDGPHLTRTTRTFTSRQASDINGSS
jgi:hypothetical protein